METIENTCLADGVWLDVVFGAYDCGFGQVMVLIVDGKPVKTFVDSSAEQISRTGGLKLYMSKGGTLPIRNPQELISDEEMNKIINEAMHKEVVNMCKQFEESAGGPMLITSVNSSKYYYNNEVQDNERSLLRLYNGTSMININDLNGIFEIKTELNGDRVTIERGNKKIIMSVGSKAAEVDGNTYTLSHEVCEIDGEVYVPIRGVSEVFNMSLAYFQGLVGISDTGYSDFINQMSLAGYTKTAFDTINKEG